MAQEIVGVKIQIDGQDAAQSAQKSIGSIRKELKEANAELIAAQREFGQYSKEAVVAAKRVAELKDAVADAREAADLFDPGKKFQAFSGALSAVAGGFSAVQGALGLVGVESEEVQKQLLKVQSALALSQGLNEITDAAPKFAGLAATIRTRVVTAFTTLRGAIAATGIGALVVGLGLLVANFDKVVATIRRVIPGLDGFVNGIRNAINAVTDLIGITSEAERGLESLNKANKARNEEIDRTIKVLSAQGGKEKEIYQLQKEQLANQLKDLTEKERIGQKLTEDELKRKKDLIADDQALEAANTKKQKDELAARNKQAADAAKQRRDKLIAERKTEQEANEQAEREGLANLKKIRDELTLAGIADETARRRKALEIQTADELKAVESNARLTAQTKADLTKAIRERAALEEAKIEEDRRKKEEDAEKDFQKTLSDLQLSIRLASIEDRNAREIEGIRANYANQLAEVEANEVLNADQKRALRLALLEKEAIEVKTKEDEIALANADRELARLQKQASDITLGFEFRKQVLVDEAALLDQYYADGIIKDDEFTKRKAENADKQIQIDRLKTQAQLDNAAKISDLLGNLSNLFGKQTAAGKVAAIAQATIDTYLSATKAYQSLSGIPVVGPALGAVAAGVAIASGLKNVREITKVPAPGGAGGGAPSISAPTATAPIAPTLPLTQTVTQLQSRTINDLQSATTRAYVVESDVTGAQERIRRLNRAARLG
jgi:hypothetical protein